MHKLKINEEPTTRFPVRRYGNNPCGSSCLSIGLLLQNPMDCEAYAAKLTGEIGLDVCLTTADLEFGLSRCARISPRILIFDPSVGSDAIERINELILTSIIEAAVLLDDTLREWRLSTILKLPRFSYLTRQAGMQELISALQRISTKGERAFDPDLTSRLRFDSGEIRFESDSRHHSLGVLTSRELEVMRLLAKGCSVRKCAELLDLAESTIDNHKSRLMKKLEIHKVVELARVAIREGLVVA